MHKILFVGPVGAGKTSAIQSVSDTEVVTTEARATDETVRRKNRTTVAMDYGTLWISDDVTIQLIGSPGQDRFDFMWEILAVGAIGIVVLIDHARPDPIADLDQYLKAFSSTLDRQGVACAVGITRMDLADDVSLQPYQNLLNASGRKIPVFEVDARSREDIRTLLMALVAMLDPRGRRRGRGGGVH